MTNTNRSTDTNNYDGPTLHELLNEIILGAEGPISIGEVVYKLMMNAEPELFFALGQELQYIRANSDIIPTLVEENPDYITRYFPNTGDGTANTSTADEDGEDDDYSDDDLIPIESGETLFEIAKKVIDEKDGPILLSELVTGIFERSTPELFDELADERAVWEYEDRPEIVWLETEDDHLLSKSDNQPEPAAHPSVRVEDKLVPLHFLIETINLLGTGFKTIANTHPHSVVTETLLASALVFEQAVTGLLNAVATIKEEEGNG